MTPYSLLITPEAAADVKRINQYLLDNWSERVRDNFIRKLRKMLAAIQILPYSYPVSLVKPELRKCVISPHVSLYYTLKSENVVMLQF